jgi:hypothetical protein
MNELGILFKNFIYWSLTDPQHPRGLWKETLDAHYKLRAIQLVEENNSELSVKNSRLLHPGLHAAIAILHYIILKLFAGRFFAVFSIEGAQSQVIKINSLGNF